MDPEDGGLSRLWICGILNTEVIVLKLKRALLVAAVIAMCAVCMGMMNIRYDRLSRYPYQDEKSRQLIDQYLNDEDIEYIIEYSIAPSTFVYFIESPGFSIYHAPEYNYLQEAFAYRNYSADQIVQMVEQTRQQLDVQDLALLMLNYTFDEVLDWLRHGDEYYSGAQLLLDPSALDAVVDDEHTIARHVPSALRSISDIPTLTVDEQGNEKTIEVDERLVDPLRQLCTAAEEEISSRSCGGLIITEGYVSYEDQKERFEQARDDYGSSAILYEDYPGHSEHQLGLAVDFALTGVVDEEFAASEQARWLSENAWRFGFVQSYTADKVEITNKLARPQHYRYVGVSLARKLTENHQTLQEAAS